MFTRAGVGGYGSAVEWDDGDLAIDAVHLKLLADAQRPFDNSQLREWQLLVRISNAEAADLVGVSLSTWASYRVMRLSRNRLPSYARHRYVIHCGCKLIQAANSWTT